MLIVNTETIAGKDLEMLGLVREHFTPSLFMGFEKQLDKIDKLLTKQAKNLGADAIVNIRYELVAAGGAITNDTVLATGTAVKFVGERECSKMRNHYE